MLKLLCATDLLPKTEHAIERAGLLADTLCADLQLLHVVAPSESSRVLEQSLEIAIARMQSRKQSPLWMYACEPEVRVRTGSPSRLILQAALHGRVDLLVLGPHRSRGMRDALEGTIASKILAGRVCPLLIVSRAPEGPYRKVMLALDESPASVAAIRAAETLVITEDVDAMVVHAFETPYRSILQSAGTKVATVDRYTSGWMTDAAIRIRDLLKHHSGAFNRYDIRIEEGRPAMGILQAAEAHRPDLLVVGTGSRGRLHRAFLGSVANEVLARANCDVLVVPEDLAQEATTRLAECTLGRNAASSPSSGRKEQTS